MSLRTEGTFSIKIKDRINGNAENKTHGLAFPYFVYVLSMMIPMMISEIPSRSLVNSIMVPIKAALKSTLSV